jgi:hypothetical protein
MLRIDASALDYLIIGLYFATVLGVGLLARRLFWVWALSRPLTEEFERTEA